MKLIPYDRLLTRFIFTLTVSVVVFGFTAMAMPMKRIEDNYLTLLAQALLSPPRHDDLRARSERIEKLPFWGRLFREQEKAKRIHFLECTLSERASALDSICCAALCDAVRDQQRVLLRFRELALQPV